MQRRIAHVLLVLGLLLTGIGAIVGYLARTVLDEGAFSARLVASLERPAVQVFVAERIADGVIAANRDLTGVKPVLASLAQGLVRSAPFQALAGRAAREAHRVAFSEGAERVMLSMPDVGVLIRGALETVSPEVAERIPADLRMVPAQLTGVVATRVLAVLRTLARIRDAARWGLVAGLLLVLGAVAVSPVRRQTLLNAGLGLLAVAAMLALLVPLGRAAVTGPIHDPTLRTVAGDVWLTFSAGLLQWAVGLAAVALMMTATVAAFVAPARLAQLAARSWHEVAGRQPTAGREWLRIVFLLVLGGFAVAEPLSTLSAATVVLGLVVLAIAVYGLVALVAPDMPSEGAETLALRLNPALTLAVGGVTLMAGALGAVAVVPRLRPAPVDVATSPVLACNGAAELCDRPFDRVTLAGAHNAMGSADNPHWMFPNQDANIAALLDRGVRALLIDVTHGHPVGDRIKTDFQSEEQRRKYEAAIGPEAFAAAMRVRDRLIGEGGETGLYMCHGFCELGAIPFDTALAQLKAFLDTHPSEVVLVVIEDRAEGAEIVGAFERQGLARYAYPGPWTAPFPTLRDMIARGQRLVVLGENVADTTSWYRPAYGVMQETPYTFHRPEDFSCRPNRGGARNPLFLMNHWIETTPAPKPSNAALVNAERVLVDRARACRRTRGRLPTVLAVDFAATGDVVRAAQVLNGLVEPTRPAGSR